MKIETNHAEFQVGDKVTYTGNAHRGPEEGIVKSFGLDRVFVVFNCGGNWEDFDQYTAAGCKTEYLSEGWRSEKETEEEELWLGSQQRDLNLH